MFRSRPALATALLLTVAVSLPAVADEVVLKDGSRILGTVKGLADGKLTIEGGDAGKVEIPLESVQSIATDGEHVLVLLDGRTLNGKLALGAGGAPELVAPTGSEPLVYGQLAGIDPPEKKPVTYDGAVIVSSKITDGNTNTKSVTSAAEITRRTEKDRLAIFGDWNYAEDSGDITQRNAKGRGKYDYFIHERLYAYGNGSLEGDEFANIDLRTTVGAGAGYQFLDDAKWKYFEEVGASYVDEDLSGGESAEYASSRVSGKVEWVIRPDRISFFHYHEVLWSLEDSDDVLVDTRTSIRFTLIEHFFATFQVNVQWDNTPATGKERTDAEYLFGLGYSFNF